MTDNIAKTSSQKNIVHRFNELNGTEEIVVDSLANLFDLLNDKSISTEELSKECNELITNVNKDLNNLKYKHNTRDITDDINNLKKMVLEAISEKYEELEIERLNKEKNKIVDKIGEIPVTINHVDNPEFIKNQQDIEFKRLTEEIPLEINYGPLEIDLDDILEGLEIKDDFIDEPTTTKKQHRNSKINKDASLDDLLAELENGKKEKSNKLLNSMTESFGDVSGAEQVKTGESKKSNIFAKTEPKIIENKLSFGK